VMPAFSFWLAFLRMLHGMKWNLQLTNNSLAISYCCS
jgi:hypothetical protein